MPHFDPPSEKLHWTTYSSVDLKLALEKITNTLADFVDRSRQSLDPVVSLQPVKEITQHLALDDYLRRSGQGSPADLLDEFIANYLTTVTRLNDPRFIGHQVARPHFASALADLVNGLTNNGMAVYEMGPGPVALEKYIVDWLLKFVPWGQNRTQSSSHVTGGGFLTHGGSIANLTALLAARGTFDSKSWQNGINPAHVFLIPDTSHYCVKRAICILGYGEKNILMLPTDSTGRIDTSQLEATYQRALNANKIPVAVCANACTTSTGLYDDLKTVGEFARAHALWFHVDGAHGASALISDAHRSLLNGIELADSLVWDQHKLLQTSALCTAILFRNPDSLNRIFQQQAAYLGDNENAEFPDLFHQTVECTKIPMGLKFFLILLATGENGLREFLEALFQRTAEIHQLISNRSGFVCDYVPQSNILCFQYRPEQLNQFEVRDQIIDQGEYYFTRTEIKGKKYFRFTVANPETTDKVVLGLLQRIENFDGRQATGSVSAQTQQGVQ